MKNRLEMSGQVVGGAPRREGLLVGLKNGHVMPPGHAFFFGGFGRFFFFLNKKIIGNSLGWFCLIFIWICFRWFVFHFEIQISSSNMPWLAAWCQEDLRGQCLPCDPHQAGSGYFFSDLLGGSPSLGEVDVWWWHFWYFYLWCVCFFLKEGCFVFWQFLIVFLFNDMSWCLQYRLRFHVFFSVSVPFLEICNRKWPQLTLTPCWFRSPGHSREMFGLVLQVGIFQRCSETLPIGPKNSKCLVGNYCKQVFVMDLTRKTPCLLGDEMGIQEGSLRVTTCIDIPNVAVIVSRVMSNSEGQYAYEIILVPTQFNVSLAQSGRQGAPLLCSAGTQAQQTVHPTGGCAPTTPPLCSPSTRKPSVTSACQLAATLILKESWVNWQYDENLAEYVVEARKTVEDLRKGNEETVRNVKNH